MGSNSAANRAGSARYGLRVICAALLGVDAYVHSKDASFYDGPRGGAVTMDTVFRIEAGAAALVALALLLCWRSRVSWLPAFLVAATAIGGVVAYRYVDLGALGPLPNMYEPTWQVPGKLLSAYAEAGTAVLSAVGFVLTPGHLPRFRPRREYTSRSDTQVHSTRQAR